MSEQTDTTQTALAEAIAQQMLEQKLIPTDRNDQVIDKIAAGKASAQDWSLWIDMAGEQEAADNA